MRIVEPTFNTRYGRVGHVAIKLANEDRFTHYYGLDFKFDITFPLASSCNEASISILGLSRKSIMSITTWGAEAIEYCKQNRIQVYAGYGEGNENGVPYNKGDEALIFDGDIVFAMPTLPPNMWLNIKARSGHYFNNRYVTGTVTKEKMPASQYYKYIVETVLGGKLIWKAKKDYEMPPLVLKSGATERSIIQQICNNGLYRCVEDTFSGESSKLQLTVEDYEVPQEDVDTAILVDADHGMIGFPKVNYASIDVTTLLNPTVKNLTFFKVDSNFVAGLSAEVYRAYQVRHQGHFRGKEWYTTLSGWRFWQDGYINNIKKKLQKEIRVLNP